MEAAISLTEIKDSKLAKKTDGKKTKYSWYSKVYGSTNFAGSTKSERCTLILCEGDSAKAGIVSGLSKEDRNTYGFPLKGKLMNTLNENQNKINQNAEIANIKKIVGLISNKVYDSESAKKHKIW